MLRRLAESKPLTGELPRKCGGRGIVEGQHYRRFCAFTPAEPHANMESDNPTWSPFHIAEAPKP